ncbi:MAG: DUF4097 family beta strand repeat-containing protein [Candidatus Acidiferrales bacterium]
MSNGSTERRSIFGGVLLILLGVLFLLHRHYPELGIGHLFRVYWPVLLIVWGLAKLIDNFAARGSGEARPPLMSGGEIALIALLFVVVAGLSTFEWIKARSPELDNMGSFWGERGVAITQELAPQPVKANAPISIQTQRGDITVFADEESNLRIIATKTVSGVNDAESRKRGTAITVNVEPVNGGYEIRPSGQTEGSGQLRVDFEVHVPKQVSITAQTDKGDININGVGGEIAATSQSGDVEIHDAGGNATATLQDGDVRITNVHGDLHVAGRGNAVNVSKVGGDATFDGDFYGSIEIDDIGGTTRFASSRTDLTILQLHGSLEMDSGSLQISDALGNLKLVTKNRDIDIENAAGRLEVADEHGDISVTLAQPPKNEINITNVSGGVDLSMPSKSTFEIAASSKSGEVDSEFNASTLNQKSEGETSRLDGKVGTRGPKISIVTSYGTIHLRNSDS